MQKRGFILMLIGMTLGIIGGLYFPNQMLSVSWMGNLFLNMLKLIALPLIFSALVSAITSMGNMRNLGSVGTYTFVYVMVSVSLAVIIGLVLINIFQPGIGVDPHLIPHDPHAETFQGVEFTAFIESMFPSNIVAAAAKFDIMPIVLFSVVFALACVATGDAAIPVIDFFTGLRNVFIKMITWLMHLTPIGLFSLLGSAVAEAVKQNKLEQSIKGMGMFIGVFMLGLLLQVLWQLLVVKYFAKRDPWLYLKSASGALMTAFGTSSSMATLPVTLMVAKEQGIRDEVARFVLPFATTISLAGTAMYEAVSAIFFSQILGMHLSIWQQIGIFFTAIVAGMGATGIPEGGLVTMVTVLRAVNIPTSAMALLLPFDRILDRFRTVVNVWGAMACTATVDSLTDTSLLANETESISTSTRKFSQSVARWFTRLI